MDISKQVNDVKWYYYGPDENVYGSFGSNEMIHWFNTGYFSENVPMRTENDQVFHALGDWIRLCGGKLPFTLPIHSWEVMAAHLRHPIAMPHPPPMHPVMLPPGLPPPPPPNMHPQRYPPFIQMPPNGMHSPAGVMPPMGMGGHPGMPNMQQHVMAPLISQPPSEPRDGHHSTNSQTPDSEGEVFVEGQKQTVLLETPVLVTEKVSVGTETMKPQMVNASTSTLPLVLNAKDVAHLLSELFGQTVRIT